MPKIIDEEQQELEQPFDINLLKSLEENMFKQLAKQKKKKV